ncbi:galactosylceramide sulfotransferase-like [Eriocheir sinensis]|uniref:galactosylceramide sulfotransferase-like n=1 Tax=Eriocheir sinensis TaxID=95602 RepID=UPI0021C6DE26|nr:galactosylceramide sulfotransferase-like [Eriocheir sinensis]
MRVCQPPRKRYSGGKPLGVWCPVKGYERQRGVYTRRLKTVVGSLVVVMVVTVLMYTPATHTAFTYTTAQLSGEVAGDGDSDGMQTEPSCTPSNHLFFLKTHKCASSTVQNILFRYGYSRNLTFALPRSGNYLGHPKYFKVGH